MRHLALAFVLFMASCRQSEPSVSNELSDFYPLKKGDSAIFLVEKKIFNELLPDSVQRYYLKEIIGQSFGANSFEIQRFKKETASEIWRFDSLWAVRVEPTRIVRIENGQPFVVLSAPIGQSWDINFYNRLEKDIFRYSVDCEKIFLCVEAADNQKNLLFKKYRTAKYEKSKGLVEQQMQILNYVNDSQSPNFGKDSVSSGVFLLIKRIF